MVLWMAMTQAEVFPTLVAYDWDEFFMLTARCAASIRIGLKVRNESQLKIRNTLNKPQELGLLSLKPKMIISFC